MSSLSRREVFGRLIRRADQAPIALSTASCLAWNGTMCYACKDVCEPRAIKFFGVFRPQITLESCTICGECVPVCPTNAITINKELIDESVS
jgi:ferredoxin-type protein NapF